MCYVFEITTLKFMLQSVIYLNYESGGCAKIVVNCLRKLLKMMYP